MMREDVLEEDKECYVDGLVYIFVSFTVRV